MLWSGVAVQAADPPAGFQSLFNGEDLTGWDGNPDFWRVEDGHDYRTDDRQKSRHAVTRF